MGKFISNIPANLVVEVENDVYTKVPFTGNMLGVPVMKSLENYLERYLESRRVDTVKQEGGNDSLVSVGNELKVKKFFTGEIL